MINVAEKLKDCPKGTKLYSPLFGEVEFVRDESKISKETRHTPFNRLAPRWINNFFHSDRHDARFEKAFAKWNKRNNDKQVINNIET